MPSRGRRKKKVWRSHLCAPGNPSLQMASVNELKNSCWPLGPNQVPKLFMPQFCHQCLSLAHQTINTGYLQMLALEHLLIISSFCFFLFSRSFYETMCVKGLQTLRYFVIQTILLVNITSIKRKHLSRNICSIVPQVPCSIILRLKFTPLESQMLGHVRLSSLSRRLSLK